MLLRRSCVFPRLCVTWLRCPRTPRRPLPRLPLPSAIRPVVRGRLYLVQLEPSFILAQIGILSGIANLFAAVARIRGAIHRIAAIAVAIRTVALLTRRAGAVAATRI